jgi:hypothetical protein
LIVGHAGLRLRCLFIYLFFDSFPSNSSTEPECWRKTYEKLLLWAGVDIFVTGHDHAVERSFPVADNKVDLECGITHLTVGSGGADDMTIGYIDEVLGTKSNLGYWKAQYW